MSSRRLFLKNSALAMFGIGSMPTWLSRALYAQQAPAERKKILIAIFQRGAVDGLNVVIPHAEKAYYRMRPSIAIVPPGSDEGCAIDLDGRFGLHPALRSLKPLWDQKQLAIVQAVGSPDPTRSHFDAQDYMESGTPGLKATPGGWLNRSLPDEAAPSSVRAVSLTAELPRSLQGRNRTITIGGLSDFQIKQASAAAAFENMYATSDDQVLNATARETFEAVRMLQSIQKSTYGNASGVPYPPGRLGHSLQLIGRIIKANVGLEVAFTDVGGWDTHVNETGAQPHTGRLANLLQEFGDSLAAFSRDMGDRVADITVVTMSEFGRTVRENGNRGTDHGHGNVMFVMGGSARGGMVHGHWPGLEQEQLYEGRDLNVTTDFREVLGEIVTKQMGNKDLVTVFPGFSTGGFPGVLA